MQGLKRLVDLYGGVEQLHSERLVLYKMYRYGTFVSFIISIIHSYQAKSALLTAYSTVPIYTVH